MDSQVFQPGHLPGARRPSGITDAWHGYLLEGRLSSFGCCCPGPLRHGDSGAISVQERSVLSSLHERCAAVAPDHVSLTLRRQVHPCMLTGLVLLQRSTVTACCHARENAHVGRPSAQRMSRSAGGLDHPDTLWCHPGAWGVSPKRPRATHTQSLSAWYAPDAASTTIYQRGKQTEDQNSRTRRAPVQTRRKPKHAFISKSDLSPPRPAAPPRRQGPPRPPRPPRPRPAPPPPPPRPPTTARPPPPPRGSCR
jgi:hypothetical protein